MDSADIRHGYLYAVFSGDDALDSVEAYLAIGTEEGFRFVHAGSFGINTQTDGPHEVNASLHEWALRLGWRLDADDIWGFWSERDELEEILFPSEAPTIDHPVVKEAEQILKENETPAGRASTWLRHSSNWKGSSLSAFFNEQGELGGAYVTVYTGNPYKLRALLRWIGVPHGLVKEITGIDELGRRTNGERSAD